MNEFLVHRYSEYDSYSEEEIDVKYIIEKKPKTVIVREFMKAQLDSIVPKDEIEFMELIGE